MGQRLASGIAKHEHGPTTLAQHFQRARCPAGVGQFMFQFEFVGEALEAAGSRGIGGGNDNQYGRETINAFAPSSVEDAFAILPGRLKVTKPTLITCRRWHLGAPPSNNDLQPNGIQPPRHGYSANML